MAFASPGVAYTARRRRTHRPPGATSRTGRGARPYRFEACRAAESSRAGGGRVRRVDGAPAQSSQSNGPTHRGGEPPCHPGRARAPDARRNQSMGKHVLITGGAGFIGSHLSDELLRQGYRVRALDDLCPQVHGAARRRPAYLDPDVDLMVGDVRVADAVKKALAGVDAA